MAKAQKSRRRNREQMYTLIELYDESGLSRSQFCEEMDIRPHTFQYWYKKYKSDRNSNIQKSDSEFIKLDILDTPVSSLDRKIIITYPGGANRRAAHTLAL